jgi:hypothetical protein
MDNVPKVRLAHLHKPAHPVKAEAEVSAAAWEAWAAA